MVRIPLHSLTTPTQVVIVLWQIRDKMKANHSRKRDASLPIDRLGESNPSKSPATFENEDIEDSIANDISDPCNQDKRTGCMYSGGIKIVHWNCQGAMES